MRNLKGWLIGFCVLCLLTTGCLAEGAVIVVEDAPQAEPVQEAAPQAAPENREPLLPIDFSKGKKPLASGFTSNSKKKTWGYEDPTISVKVEMGRAKGGMGCDYWVATVKIKDASQLRTASRDGFDLDHKIEAAKLAKRQNAVLAINGDYFCYTGKGLILRQGNVYLDLLDGDRDILLVDEDGDFHGVRNAQRGQVAYDVGADGKKVYEINGKKVINAFYFGPLLVVDGKANNKMKLRDDMAAKEKRQRMAIAQIGPLEYKCICCAPPARGNTGMDLKTFAGLVAKQNVKIAYNLDGGNSTMMILNGKKINNEKAKDDRAIVDIIYFASAYDGE